MLLGLVLTGYGVVEVWLGNLSDDSLTKQRFCASWLCPGGAAEAKAFALQQRSEGGAAVQIMPEFQQALALSSASASNWANLAEAERDSGNDKLAEYCFKHAVAAAPMSPPVLFRAANYEFEQGRAGDALKTLAPILRDPELTSYYQPVFLTYSRLGIPIEEVIAQGVPAVDTAAKPFLQFWMDRNRMPESEAVWQWMLSKGMATEQASGDYVAFLLRNQLPGKALEEWQRLHRSTNSTYRVLNWMYNSGFESELAPGPLDWHVGSTDHVEATRVEDVSHEGQWSARLVFDGKADAEYHDLYQYAVLTPGRWHIRAFLKLEDVTGSSGVALRVYDVEMPARLDVRTATRSGTSAWDQVEQVFDAGSETKLVRVELMRAASASGGDKIGGRVWMDSVELAPARENSY